MHRHAGQGRCVTVNGRLAQQSWRDRKTSETRSRIIVAASDVDLHIDIGASSHQVHAVGWPKLAFLVTSLDEA